MGWPRQSFKGRGAAGGGRRLTSFFLGFGCPREFWSSERAGGCSRGISYHGRCYPGGGYIDNDDIHTWENNVIGEGVGRTPPRVEVIGTRGISTTTYPIKNKKTKNK